MTADAEFQLSKTKYKAATVRENGTLPGCLENDWTWSQAAISIAMVVSSIMEFG